MLLPAGRDLHLRRRAAAELPRGRDVAAAAKLHVKVVPGAARTEIVGWMGDTLKIRVAAPPERGRANRAVETLVAGALGVPRRAVTVTAGSASARKTISVEGLSAAEVRTRLQD